MTNDVQWETRYQLTHCSVKDIICCPIASILSRTSYIPWEVFCQGHNMLSHRKHSIKDIIYPMRSTLSLWCPIGCLVWSTLSRTPCAVPQEALLQGHHMMSHEKHSVTDIILCCPIGSCLPSYIPWAGVKHMVSHPMRSILSRTLYAPSY